MTDFFDFKEKLTSRSARAGGAKAERAAAGEMLSVSQLTRMIESAIRKGVPAPVLVHGELSNVNVHQASGHIYFTMKDDDACIDCVMWKSDAARLKFQPTDGEEVLASGSIGVYGSRGRYQLYARSLEPMGRGALELAYRQLYAKLEAEGLFETSRKRPLPSYPIRIALVTSRDGAALQDMLKVLRRFRWLKVSLVGVPVQGDGAAEKIAGAISTLNRKATGRADVILMARGGGSLEDLWEFNEEVVARAIVASSIPIVTGIGHEVDTSIADLVADFHAHTPTEAAQVVTAQWRTVKEELDGQSLRLRRAMRAILQDARQRLSLIERHETFRRPRDRVNQLRQRLDDRQRSLGHALRERLRRFERRLESLDSRWRQRHPKSRLNLLAQKLGEIERRLITAVGSTIERKTLTLQRLDAQLSALSPAAVLKRGYSITTVKRGGAVVRSVDAVRAGDTIVTRVSDGSIESTVEDSRQPKLFE